MGQKFGSRDPVCRWASARMVGRPALRTVAFGKTPPFLFDQLLHPLQADSQLSGRLLDFIHSTLGDAAQPTRAIEGLGAMMPIDVADSLSVGPW